MFNLLKLFMITFIFYGNVYASSYDIEKFNVPIRYDNNKISSSLYLSLKTQNIEKEFEVFKNEHSDKEDKIFYNTVHSISSIDVAEFKQLAMPIDGIESDEEFRAYLKQAYRLHGEFNDLKVLKKVKLLTGYAYIWSIRVEDSEIITASFFENINDSLLFKNYLNLDSLETLTMTTLSYHYENLTIKEDIGDLKHKVELERKDGKEIGVNLEFNGEIVLENVINDNKKNLSGLTDFFKQLKIDLSDLNFKSFSQKLSKSSFRRLGGMPAKSEDKELISDAFELKLIPNWVVGYIDATPFYIVISSNMSNNEALPSLVEQYKKEEKGSLQNLSIHYLKKVKHEYIMTGVNLGSYLNDVLLRNDFLKRKISNELILNNQ